MAGLFLAYGVGALVFAGILPGILRRYPGMSPEKRAKAPRTRQNPF